MAIVEGRESLTSQSSFFFQQIFDLHQKPVIDLGHRENFIPRQTQTECVAQIPDTISTGYSQLLTHLVHGLWIIKINLTIKAVHADFQTSQCFLHGLLEGTANRHHLTHGFHLGGQASIGLWEFLKGEPRNLGDHIVNRRLKRGRCHATGDIVLKLIQGVTHRQLGGNLGNREAGRLGSQRRGAGHARVHLNDHHTAIFGIDTKLHVGATGLNTDLTQYRQRGITHQLVFTVGQGLGRGHGDRVTGVNTHGIKVFD